jgi:hypothetical protein
MKVRLRLGLMGPACLILVGCNPPPSSQGGEGETEIVAESEIPAAPVKSGPPEFVKELWERSVEIAKPCENAAAALADRIAMTSPQNAKPEAQRGLDTCENALEKQNALRVPTEAEGDLAVTLDAAIHKCREALDARRKFFESSILVLDGDTSEWRTGMVSTSSLVAQGRSEDCIAFFREAGLEI